LTDIFFPPNDISTESRGLRRGCCDTLTRNRLAINIRTKDSDKTALDIVTLNVFDCSVTSMILHILNKKRAFCKQEYERGHADVLLCLQASGFEVGLECMIVKTNDHNAEGRIFV
jgi:hypothetical protein